MEALCWCGKRATHNARTENGVMVTEGEVIVVGDVESSTDEVPPEVGYEVLCRQHHRRGLTAGRAQAVSMIGEPLPFGDIDTAWARPAVRPRRWCWRQSTS